MSQQPENSSDLNDNEPLLDKETPKNTPRKVAPTSSSKKITQFALSPEEEQRLTEIALIGARPHPDVQQPSSPSSSTPLADSRSKAKVFSTFLSLTSISTVKLKNKNSENVDLVCKTKIGRSLHFHVPQFFANKASPDLASHISSFVPRAPPKLFAFSNEEFSGLKNNPEAKDSTVGSLTNGWQWYDERKELARIMRGAPAWRETEANVEYQLCKTYSRYIGVPSQLTDEDLYAVAKFRSSNRLPILSWIHPETKASIVRCSQPMVGLKRQRSAEDERYFALVRATTNADRLFVLDARPKANVLGNTAMGGGVEDGDFYPNCEIEFLDISNIHAMRDSFHKMHKLVHSQGADHVDDSSWLSNLAQTQWLAHIRTVMVGAVRMVDIIEHSKSIITHCSDGWDRTSQLTSLAMLLMDPAYRTLQGFAILIEKEWLGAGHKFSQRCGHAEFVDDKDQTSPIFLQFLDSVHQCLLQHPLAFEFNEQFLLFLAEEYYSCRFGTFLYNCDRLRRANAVAARTPSIWTYVHQQRRQFLNPFYKSQNGTIRPLCGFKRLRVWQAFFLAFTEQPGASSEFHARRQLAQAYADEKEQSANMWHQIDMLKTMIRTLDEENNKLRQK